MERGLKKKTKKKLKCNHINWIVPLDVQVDKMVEVQYLKSVSKLMETGSESSLQVTLHISRAPL